MSIFSKADILLPDCVNMEKWSVVACDQYTAQPEYWKRVEEFVGSDPSTLKIVYPEAFLSEGDSRIAAINAEMQNYLDKKIFAELEGSLIYVERTMNSGKIRRGLIGQVDLECYDFSKGSKSEIRATEGTIIERIPPRVKIRENAPVELPHAILLMNDPKDKIMGSIAKERPLYDFDLMEGGGHISGWLVSGMMADALVDRIDAFAKTAKDNLVFAVGDGNHSLATAKTCWENIKNTIPEKEWSAHPARYCLVEIENIHDKALEFEPIHRVVFGQTLDSVAAELKKYYAVSDVPVDGSQEIVMTEGDKTERFYVTNPSSGLEVGTLQNFLDKMGYELDYIHGEEVTRELSNRGNAVGFILPCPEKNSLFETVISDGALPRKTFSMGEANEKRFYLEAKKIK
ncbi:MAG: DUF1015 domain-containing protein [Ruminococcaceae bacterium]|nr:DUF1015 domain-containing protein [Oscillospiraceae bacterium]